MQSSHLACRFSSQPRVSEHWHTRAWPLVDWAGRPAGSLTGSLAGPDLPRRCSEPGVASLAMPASDGCNASFPLQPSISWTACCCPPQSALSPNPAPLRTQPLRRRMRPVNPLDSVPAFYQVPTETVQAFTTLHFALFSHTAFGQPLSTTHYPALLLLPDHQLRNLCSLPPLHFDSTILCIVPLLVHTIFPLLHSPLPGFHRLLPPYPLEACGPAPPKKYSSHGRQAFDMISLEN